MDWEKTLDEAMDLMADFRDAEAEATLQKLIVDLKDSLTATDKDADLYYFWGRCLSLLEEPEQALLRFEQALQLRPEHEDSWWQTVSVLLWDLDRPESAKTILVERLLKMRPKDDLYLETLDSAETLIRRRQRPAGKAQPDEGEPPEEEGMPDDAAEDPS